MAKQYAIRAGWIIPVQPRGTVLEDAVIVLEGDRIAGIHPAADFPAERVDEHLPEQILLPGLVNAHTHLAMTLMRGIADDLPLMTWLQDHIWPLEGRIVNAEFCHDGALLGLAESLRGGVTCVNDMYFHPQATVSALRQLGMRGQVGMILLDFPTPYAADGDEYFAKAQDLHDSLAGDQLIGTMFAPHAPYTVGDDNLQRMRKLADELGVRVHMHVHETAHEVQEAEQQSGSRPLARLAKLGLLNESLSAVHMTQLTAAEIQQLADVGASVIHCPESNLKLASGFCPSAQLSAAGVNLALGTDGAASNNDLDLLGEARTAGLLAKGVAGDAAALPGATLLEMATLGGARALGLDDRIGSLEVGKQADLIALSVADLETRPMFDPISQLIYAANRQQVQHAWVGGERRLRKREVVGLDVSALKDTVATWQQRIQHD